MVSDSHCVKIVHIRSYSGLHFFRIFQHSDWIRRDTSKCFPQFNQGFDSPFGMILLNPTLKSKCFNFFYFLRWVLHSWTFCNNFDFFHALRIKWNLKRVSVIFLRLSLSRGIKQKRKKIRVFKKQVLLDLRKDLKKQKCSSKCH